MELSYETQGTNTYLVYAVPQDEQLDMVSVGMLVNNHIPGLARTIFTQLDCTRYIKYNISAKVPANQLFMSPISKQRFLGVLNGIVNAMLSAEEYMLEPGTILLELGQIYSDVRTGETVLICVPSEERTSQGLDLRDFIKRIMYDTSFDQSENCDYITKIINYLNKSPALVLPDFQEFLRSLSVEQPQPVQPERSPQPTVETSAHIQALERPARPAETPPRQPPISQPPPRIPEPPAEISPVAPEPTAEEETAAEDKPISLMYLLRHYSKENAAAYKAQQEKGKKTSAPSKRSKKKEEAPVSAGFAVPGVKNSAPQREEPKLLEPRRPEPQPVSVGPVPAASVTPVRPPQPAPQGAAQSFGETDYFPDAGERDETVILGMEQSAQQVVIPFLVRRMNNERIPVNKAIFRLGRDVEFNDYAILDNRYVGHSHCHLIQQDGEYFIQDDNSKNHTKVNGRVIPPGQPVKITHGDTISVANEEFEFKLY